MWLLKSLDKAPEYPRADTQLTQASSEQLKDAVAFCCGTGKMTASEKMENVEFLVVNASEAAEECLIRLVANGTRKLASVGQAAGGYLAPEKSVAGIAQAICFGSK